MQTKIFGMIVLLIHEKMPKRLILRYIANYIAIIIVYLFVYRLIRRKLEIQKYVNVIVSFIGFRFNQNNIFGRFSLILVGLMKLDKKGPDVKCT